MVTTANQNTIQPEKTDPIGVIQQFQKVFECPQYLHLFQVHFYRSLLVTAGIHFVPLTLSVSTHICTHTNGSAHNSESTLFG